MKVVIAFDDTYSFGNNDGTLPWGKNEEDLKQFKKQTTPGTLLAGRKTWDSLPENMKACPQRQFIIVSSETDLQQQIDQACACINPCIIGGAILLKTVLLYHLDSIDELCITKIRGSHEADIKVNWLQRIIEDHFVLSTRNQGETCVFETYTRQYEEMKYINLLKKVLHEGVVNDDRTGVGTISLFGGQMSFDMSRGVLPILTTKRVFLKGVIHELLWFINGHTDSNILSEKGVNIWKGNTSREYLDAHGHISRPEGDIGPGYGHQWRHYNAKYTDMHADYTNKGIDQLTNCVKQIKHEIATRKHDRRIIMIAWNPEQISEMSFPPCHIFVQFYVCLKTMSLSLHMYQRSADMFLGVPFNIASYALLLLMTARVTGLNPDRLVMSFGDMHIYSTHIEAVNEQLTRCPMKFPKVEFVDPPDELDQFIPEHIVVKDYKCHAKLSAPMAV